MTFSYFYQKQKKRPVITSSLPDESRYPSCRRTDVTRVELEARRTSPRRRDRTGPRYFRVEVRGCQGRDTVVVPARTDMVTVPVLTPGVSYNGLDVLIKRVKGFTLFSQKTLFNVKTTRCSVKVEGKKKSVPE